MRFTIGGWLAARLNNMPNSLGKFAGLSRQEGIAGSLARPLSSRRALQVINTPLE
jgi:hypothetical protein